MLVLALAALVEIRRSVFLARKLQALITIKKYGSGIELSICGGWKPVPKELVGHCYCFGLEVNCAAIVGI
jgi:hypothetical protein